MHHYFQTEITIENLIWASRRQEFISYQRINQAQGIADQDWSFTSSLLMRHLDQLANKAFRENKPVFPFLAVSRKKTNHRQTHDAASPANHSSVWRHRACGKEHSGLYQERADALRRLGHGKGLADTRRETCRRSAPARAQCGSSSGTAAPVQRTLISEKIRISRQASTSPARPKW